MGKPLIMVIDDPVTVEALAGDLRRRFGGDYEVVGDSSPTGALVTLEHLKAAGESVALLIVGQWLPGVTGLEVLAQAHDLHPKARRVVLITYGDSSVSEAILTGMTLGQIDDYFAKPWGPPEERLYPAIGDLISAWWRATSPGHLELVQVVGPRWSPRSHELRDLLSRNGIPNGFYDGDSAEGRRLLEERGRRRRSGRRCCCSTAGSSSIPRPRRWRRPSAYPPGRPPAATTSRSSAPARPAWRRPSTPPPRASRTLVLEREAVGGQAGTSSMIRNYLGFPRGVSGADLATAGLRSRPGCSAPTFVYAQAASGLRADGEDRVV